MSVAALIISILAVVIAGLVLCNSRQTTLHHVLEDIRKDYRSPEMYRAVKTIWEFYKDCQKNTKNFVDKYFEIFEEDNKKLAKLEENQRVKAEQSTLHYQRRLVSHFYQYVAALRSNRVLPGGIIYDTWAEEDLRIIPNILIPIETRLSQVVPTPPLQPIDEANLPRSLLPLYNLYKDSKEKTQGTVNKSS